MRKLIAVLFLLAATAQAESLPNGCYVAFSNPQQCFAPNDNQVTWIDSDGRQNIANRYGSVVEVIIKQTLDLETLLREYFDKYKTATDSVAQNAVLIKKLKRACGAKCRRIK